MVKFLLVKGFLVVSASLNQHGPFLFLVDTGATASSITPAAARTAGLLPDHRVTLAAAGGDRTAPAASNVTLQIGPASASGVEVVILPLDSIRSIDPRIQGVIGQNFLSRFPCLLDYREHRLWLGEEASRRAEHLPTRLPAEIAAGRIIVPVTIDARKPQRLVLDSGASDLTLSCGNRCPHLAVSEENADLRTNTGTRAVRRGVLTAIQVGDIRILRPTVALLERTSASTVEDGLLPANLFVQVYLAPGSKEIRLSR